MKHLQSARYLISLLGMLVVMGLITVSTAQAVNVTGAMLSLVNSARGSAGAGSVSSNNLLVDAAQRHSDWMVTCGQFSHTGGGGSQPWDRVGEAGYGWSTVGENILYRYDNDVTAAFNQWMASSGHKANIENGSFTEIGVAYTQDAGGRYYFTMVLAAPGGGGGSATYSCAGGGGGGSDGTSADGNSGDKDGSQELPDGRLNPGGGDPITVYCTTNGGMEVYAINAETSQGSRVISATGAQVKAALDAAVSSGSNTTIGTSGAIGLYALHSNEIQAMAPDLVEPRKIHKIVLPGDVCGVPLSTATPGSTTPTTGGNNGTTTTPITPTGGSSYIVQAGDNLFRIALRFNTTVAALVAANNLTDATRIFVGQSLIIPGAGTPTTTTATPTTTTASGDTYVVQAGDTLFSIARRFNVSLVTLAQVNNIVNINLIFVGQKLQIP